MVDLQPFFMWTGGVVSMDHQAQSGAKPFAVGTLISVKKNAKPEPGISFAKRYKFLAHEQMVFGKILGKHNRLIVIEVISHEDELSEKRWLFVILTGYGAMLKLKDCILKGS
ncbi:hypothetical protein EJB05_00389, partial [Eragrostis curvula]